MAMGGAGRVGGAASNYQRHLGRLWPINRPLPRRQWGGHGQRPRRNGSGDQEAGADVPRRGWPPPALFFLERAPPCPHSCYAAGR